ncbi:MAG TPA: response regulator [Planctomycetaceae bacterium]|nr:response regulator [Planctomycetaceae bacterium]
MLPDDTQQMIAGQCPGGDIADARDDAADDDDTAIDRRSLRVLIVDDEPQMAESLRALVSSWGHRAQGACDAQAGLALAAVHAFDVVLFGIGLPGMDGYALAKELRRDMRLKHCFLVAMSGGFRPRGPRKEANIDMFLSRPIDAAALETLLLFEGERLDRRAEHDAAD